MCQSLFFPLAFFHMHLLGMLYKEMSPLREGRECSPVFKSCHQDPDTGEDFFLSSLHYFPEQIVISSIFHAYGHECLALPHLNINKKGISWFQSSFEDKEGMKTSLEIWCFSCWLTHAFLCFLFPSCWCQRQTLRPSLCAPLPIPPNSNSNKEVRIFSGAGCCDTYIWWYLKSLDSSPLSESEK